MTPVHGRATGSCPVPILAHLNQYTCNMLLRSKFGNDVDVVVVGGGGCGGGVTVFVVVVVVSGGGCFVVVVVVDGVNGVNAGNVADVGGTCTCRV